MSGDRWRLSLLGGFRLAREDRVVRLAHSAQRLVAFLALQARPVLRVEAAGTLWPDVTDARSVGNLRSTLWRLDRHARGVVEREGAKVALGAFVHVDIDHARTDVAAIAHGEGLARTGELLPGWYEDWVLVERERVRQSWLDAMEAISEYLVTRGEPARAVEVALRAVAMEPLRESSHRTVMRAHLARGNRAAALAQCDHYLGLLEDAGLAPRPSPALQSLLDETRVGAHATAR